MTTLTTERLVELRDRLKGAQVEGLTLYVCNCDHRVDTDSERDIIAALSRLIEAEAENVRLQAEIDANAWNISPAMAQATIEQHWERIQKLQAELAAAKETIATLQNRVDELEAATESTLDVNIAFSDGTDADIVVNGKSHYIKRLETRLGYWSRIEDELAAIKAEVGPEPAMKAPEIDGLPHDKALHNALLALGEAGFAVIHYKHRAEHLAARNAELVKALQEVAG